VWKGSTPTSAPPHPGALDNLGTMDRPDKPETGAARHPPDPSPARLLPVIAVGGIAGSLARYGLTVALPTPGGGMPWATLIANLTGALLLGLLTVLLVDTLPRNPYLRPLLGVGVLGGYTTFSTYTSETRALLDGGHAGTALLYLLATVGVGFLAALAGFRLGRVVATAAGRRTR
jgi:CrcB protein